jgi:hypothetical protein
MAQSFVIGDILWTCDAAVFLGIWAREAVKAQGWSLRPLLSESSGESRAGAESRADSESESE